MARWTWLVLAALISCSYPKPRNFQEAVYLETLEVDTAALQDYSGGVTSFSIGPFDRLHVSIWQYPDLTGEVLVKDDGTVFLPNAGNVDVKGLSLREAQQKLTQSLAPYVPQPQLDLRPVEVRSSVFYVAGEFSKPGAYPVMRPLRLAEAVALAGGFSENALIDNAYLSRRGRAWPVNLRESYSDPGEEVYIQSGDILFVPSQLTARVYVLGEVKQPGAVPIANGGLGVIQAIAASGGIRAGASEDEVAVLRRVENKIQLRVINVDSALRYGTGGALLFRLRPGDIVWVPPTGLAEWNRSLELIAPTLDTLLFRPLGGVRDFFIIKDIIDNGGD